MRSADVFVYSFRSSALSISHCQLLGHPQFYQRDCFILRRVVQLLDLDPSRIFLIHFLDQPPHVEKLVQFVNAGVNRVDLVLDPALAVLRVFVPFLDQVDCPVKAPHRQLERLIRRHLRHGGCCEILEAWKVLFPCSVGVLTVRPVKVSVRLRRGENFVNALKVFD